MCKTYKRLFLVLESKNYLKTSPCPCHLALLAFLILLAGPTCFVQQVDGGQISEKQDQKPDIYQKMQADASFMSMMSNGNEDDLMQFFK